MEFMIVLTVVGLGFLAVFMAGGLLLLVGVFLAAVLKDRSMGHRDWLGKLRYAVQKTFG